MIKIGTILWHPVRDGRLVDVEYSTRVEDKADYAFRIDFDSCSEPQLISGANSGMVAVTKRYPPRDWTHAVVIGMSPARTLAFIRFCYDHNIMEYLKFRKKIDQFLKEDSPTECVVYPHMEPGFRRIKEPMLDVVYV